MEIGGKRVVLREIEEQDEEMLLHLNKVPEAGKVTGGYSSQVSYAHQIGSVLWQMVPGMSAA